MKIMSGKSGQFADVENFILTLSDSFSNGETFGFSPQQKLIVTRAPGRLDVMGGIADYSGSLVLQMPIREATIAVIQARDDRKIKITSMNDQQTNRDCEFEMSLDEIYENNSPINYEKANLFFRKNSRTRWAGYVAGAFFILAREKKANFPHGATLLIRSEVPEGKGVSSSAALEVASMEAINALYNLDLSSEEIALLSQKVENFIVGAPCGVMDQMTAVFGRENELMALLCQPAQLLSPVKIPDEIQFCGLDSGVRHSVSGSDYSSVRTGAFMGYRIIAEKAGLEAKFENDKFQIKDPIWNGYLANISPSEFEQVYRAVLPEEMSGNQFLSEFKGTTDRVTQVRSDVTYPILHPTKHPIYENFRVNLFSHLLRAPISVVSLNILGELMYQSHASYSACGLGSPETDLLVELAKQTGEQGNVFGAKITGGGSGGTVAFLIKKSETKQIHQIREKFHRKTGHKPYLFIGSSDGSRYFGKIEIVIQS